MLRDCTLAGRQFICSTFLPQGPNYLHVDPHQKLYAVTGADPSASIVHGSKYLATTFQNFPEHLWTNLGILFAIMSFLAGLYLLATEFISAQRSKGEVLIFRRCKVPRTKPTTDEEEAQGAHRYSDITNSGYEMKGFEDAETCAATFLWNDLCYDVRVKGGSRQLLDNVEGWIQPRSLTALIGATGAGKTTLLNVLANRASTGVISGEKLTGAKYQDEGFARKVGYAQQQDFNTPKSTVREALIFSDVHTCTYRPNSRTSQSISKEVYIKPFERPPKP